MKKTSVQLTEAAVKQVERLSGMGYGSQSDVIRTAIDRMYKAEVLDIEVEDFRVYEDNAGGLYLFVLDEVGAALYAHDYSDHTEDLAQDVLSLVQGAGVDGWDGHQEDLAFDEVAASMSLVADQDGTYVRQMGVAAEKAFAAKDVLYSADTRICVGGHSVYCPQEFLEMARMAYIKGVEPISRRVWDDCWTDADDEIRDADDDQLIGLALTEDGDPIYDWGMI